MTRTTVIRKDPVPELFAWALDFPQQDNAPRITERGLYLQGWVLTQPGQVRGDLVVRSGEGEAASLRRLPFNNARPDVVQRVLGMAPADHPQLRCGFIAYLKDAPAEFTLGVTLGDTVHWLCEVRLDAEATAPVAAPRQAAQVIVGREGWLYLDNDTNRSVDQFTGRLQLDAAGLARWKDYLDGCAALATRRQLPHAVMIAASKEQVLPEFYPHSKGVQTVHEQVLGLCGAEHHVIDTAALLAQREDRTACFIRTDTHWTDRGAMAAVLAMLSQLGLDAAAACTFFEDDVYYTMPFAGDLGIKLSPPASAPTEFLQTPAAVSGASFDNRLPNIGRVLVFDNDRALWQRRLLVFGASSSYPMLKYLKRLFARIVFVHSAGNVDQRVVDHERPDLLLMQTTARFMIEPPDLAFDLAAAIRGKLANANPDLRAQVLASGAGSAAANLFYSHMLEPTDDKNA